MKIVDVHCLNAAIGTDNILCLSQESCDANFAMEQNSEVFNSDTSYTVEYISQPISYATFLTTLMSKNKPCLFANWITKEWQCCKQWIAVSADHKILADFSSFKDLSPSTLVSVANCRLVCSLRGRFTG